MVRRLVALGLAEDLLAVTTRLGCAVGGQVDLRRQVATGMLDRHLTVLVGCAGDVARHVSIHWTAEDAETVQIREQTAYPDLVWGTYSRQVAASTATPTSEP